MMQFLPLFSGSSGNASFLRFGDTRLLIDAGVSCKRIEDALMTLGESFSGINGILVTHEHDDHVKGLERLSKKYHLPVYIGDASLEYLKCNKPSDNLLACAVKAEAGETLTFGDISVKLFRTPHDAFGSVGFRFDFSDGTSLGYATDIGYMTKGIAASLFGCETVLLESNHDIRMLENGPYPYYLKQRILSDKGHLSNAACAAFLPYLYEHGTKKVILAHLSEHNNTPRLAFDESRSALDEKGIGNEECRVTVAMKSII